MKTIKRLNIKNKPSYFFSGITNINDFDPEFLLFSIFTITDDLSITFNIYYFEEDNTPHTVFSNSVFFKKVVFFVI